MPAIRRSACLSNYVDVARSIGLDPLPLLREVGIHPSDLNDPDTKISFEAVVQLLEDTAKKSGVDDFGLRMAETRRLSNLGPLVLLAYVEANVREALLAMIRFLPVHIYAIEICVEEANGIAVISRANTHVNHFACRQEIEMSIGVLHRLLSSLLGEHWRPLGVCFSHAPPKNRSRHERLLGVRIDFNRDIDGILCRSSDLDRPIETADAVTARHVHRLLAAMIDPRDASLTTQVRRVVSSLLSTGRCSAENVAGKLGLSLSSFFRKMTQEEASYAEILDAARMELAAHYLSNPQRSLSEVAELLGYSSLSAFSRWFKEQHGCSPSRWRKTASNVHSQT